MKGYPATRKSHCSVCGNRLSKKTSAGGIAWQPSHVDDRGIICDECHSAKTGTQGQKKTQK
jgi:hypothetical protein